MSSVLNGKIIISTRPQGKSKDLQELLQKHGATLYELPMIELSGSQNTDEINKVLKQLKSFTHIAFTSGNAFRFFYDKISKTAFYKENLEHIKIASIGYRTSEIIKNYGIQIDFNANARDGREFAQKLAHHIGNEKANILWPTGNLSPNTFIENLKSNMQIARLNIYENTAPKNVNHELLTLIQNNQYDMIIIASPSAINHLSNYIDINNLNITCIGQTSASAVRAKGLQPKAIALEPNANGLLQALIQYYSQNQFTKQK
ncbi:uroporphyrinogen-III synthase [Labilibacter sediminis]|nr:uroporphyrinogen-III synthase [Labilibacter sediminis]